MDLRQTLVKSPVVRYLYDIYLMLFRRTFFGGRMATCHNADFQKEDRFKAAFARAMERGNLGYAWNTKLACWAAQQALKLEGDFVECGTNRGSLNAAILEYVDWLSQKNDRRFYMFDTFSGLVDSMVSDADMGAYNYRYVPCYEETRDYFAKYPGVTLVQGVVPESLSTVKIDKVAYLSIDMNCAAPEKAALEYFWPRLVSGGVILLDDYGWRGYENQKRVHDDFARSVGHEVLPLPTGQGLIIKRHSTPNISSVYA